MKKFLTVSEAAERMNVNSETLRRWDKSGKFTSSRHPINNYRVYSEDQVESFVEDMQMEISYRKKEITQDSIDTFFKTSYGKLYKGDSLQLLKTFEPGSVDLIFADPPYNIKKAEWDTFSSQKEYVEWSMEWIAEASRILKGTGSLYICGFSEILADVKWSASRLFKGCKWLVWFYRNKANLGNDWGRSHESILHFRKSKNFKFHIDEVRIPYNEHTLKYPSRPQAESSQYAKGRKEKKQYVWEPNPLGAKPKDVLEIPTISNASWERYSHETQKPVELLRRIILASSDEGDLVLDPFGGSGTTYAVAEAYSRNWVGIEKEKNYCEIIKERLSDYEHLNRIRSEVDSVESQRRRQKLRG
ncbi:DNA methyltransferase [Marinoscillum sp.]|uniref:DNA methyltransferase n=1 Tax=Marinoscillum sp. TaxID=2024838 RepID=UPI003BAB9850